MMRGNQWLSRWTLVAATFALAAGCDKALGPSKGPKADSSTKQAPGKEKAHAHAHPDEGPHRGPLAEWGEEEYHAEFTVDHKAGQATVYILDDTAKKPKPVKAKQITLNLKLTPPVSMTLEASPQEGDPAGMASRFVGKHAALAKEQEFEGTISGEVDGKPYAGDFKEKDHEHEKK